MNNRFGIPGCDETSNINSALANVYGSPPAGYVWTDRTLSESESVTLYFDDQCGEPAKVDVTTDYIRRPYDVRR